jgi:hypothetical protein
MGKEPTEWNSSQKVSVCQICETYGVVGECLTPVKFQETPNAEVTQIYVCTNCLESLDEDGYVEK